MLANLRSVYRSGRAWGRVCNGHVSSEAGTPCRLQQPLLSKPRPWSRPPRWLVQPLPYLQLNMSCLYTLCVGGWGSACDYSHLCM